MAQTKIKAGLFEGIIGNGTDGYFLMSNGDGTMTWSSIIINPTIASIAYPGSVTAADPDGGETITLTGTGFKTGATVTVGGTAAPAVSYVSETQITFTTPAKAAGDYDIVVTNADTGSATYINGISYNGIPSWTTAAGSLGTFASDETISTITLQATEPDAGTITFNITSGALPTGLSLTGADIDGTTSLETADTLYTFTVTATDDESQSTPRTFTITVKKEFKSVDNFTINTYTGNGSTQSIEGKIGTAASFNGSSSRIVAPKIPGLSSASISCWVKTTNTASVARGIVELNNDTGSNGFAGTLSIIYNTGSGTFTIRNGNGSSSEVNLISHVDTAIRNGNWHHIVVARNESTGVTTLYIDGTQAAQQTVSSTSTAGPGTLIGDRHYTASNYHWDGEIDQVRIFNKAISSSEVTTLYGESNTSTTKSTTDIFDDGSGVALYEFEKGAKDTGGVSGYIGSNSGIFDGSSTYITIPATAASPFDASAENFTISAWINVSAFRNDACIISKWGSTASTQSYFFGFNGSADNTKLIVYEKYGSSNYIVTSTSTAITTGSWFHVAYVRNSTQTIIYINGTAETFSNNNTINSAGSQPIIIGRQDGYSGTSFNGKIDQVRIFNKAISSSEIATLYGETSASSTKSTTDIFDDGSGVALYELEGNANDTGSTYNGTPTNVTYGYDGTPTNVSFVGTSFQPDLVFTKSRSFTEKMNVFDSVRGATKRLYPTDTHTEATQSNSLTSFNSNGWSIGAWTDSNTNNETFVSYAFKGGGTAVSNTDGSITSSVSANQDAGFSIVKYTGESAARTVGHGLSSAPELVIIKNLDDTRNWMVYHKDLSASSYMFLNLTNAEETDTRTNGGQARPFGPFTSTTFGVNLDNETGHTNDYIAYCFHSVDGYQKVGSYTGTGQPNNDVTTGFRPRWVMIKSTAAQGWNIVDSVRNPSNPANLNIQVDSTAAESSTANPAVQVDFDDTGFSLVAPAGTPGEGQVNSNGSTYIYLAIA
jgi:hypothetical protein